MPTSWTDEEIRAMHKCFVQDHYQSWLDAVNLVAMKTKLDVEYVMAVVKNKNDGTST